MSQEHDLFGNGTQPRMSNRRRAMMEKQQASPFASIEVPDAVRSQIGANMPSQSPAAYVQPQTASEPPQISINKRGNETPVAPEDLKVPKEGIFSRIRGYFADRNARQVYNDICIWLSEHALIFAIVAVALIVVGLLVSRYISFAGAIALLVIGWIVNFNKNTDETFAFYIYALAVFMIPYLF